VTQLHVRAVFVRKSPRRIIMRPDRHSGVLYTPVEPAPLGGAFPPKQSSAEAAPTESMSTAAAIKRVLLIAVVSSFLTGTSVNGCPRLAGVVHIFYAVLRTWYAYVFAYRRSLHRCPASA
jgi:hypothetical protein